MLKRGTVALPHCRAVALRQLYTEALARYRAFPIPSCPGGFLCFVNPCTGEAEVPFGRTMIRFLVKVEGYGNVCCFRLRRVAKRNDGVLVGADWLADTFAKGPLCAGRGVRDCDDYAQS